MNTEMILQSNALDILFENRNKLYGAYQLRKSYPERIKVSLMIMLCIVIAFCIFASIDEKSVTAISTFDFEDPFMAKVDPGKKLPETKKTTPIQKAIFNSQKFISNIKLENDSADILADDMENKLIGGITFRGGLDGTNIVGNEMDGKEPQVEVPKELRTPDPAIPVENPEVEPSYPGGINALRTFLQKNLTNPSELEEGKQVSVQIRFIVGYDGKLQHFETIKDGGVEFNNEVIRVLKKMPQWIAGKSNGKNVSVYYTIPVKFVPND